SHAGPGRLRLARRWRGSTMRVEPKAQMRGIRQVKSSKTLARGSLRLAAGIALTVALSACAALNRADTPATLIAENAAYATEIVALDAAATQETSDSSLRAAELATSAAHTNGVNAQLVGTLQVVVTPTPQ